jgi:signal transduction histidine kinase
MLRRIMPTGITIVTDVPAELRAIRISGTALTQVLVNLATNARDAMPDGGSIRIAARDLDVGPGDRTGDTIAQGRFVRITVSDSGVGMDEATASRAFEAFFSTKTDGATARGTGLGLSSVFLIVTKAAGSIHVESAPGEGTTFTVDLPAAE